MADFNIWLGNWIVLLLVVHFRLRRWVENGRIYPAGLEHLWPAANGQRRRARDWRRNVTVLPRRRPLNWCRILSTSPELKRKSPPKKLNSETLFSLFFNAMQHTHLHTITTAADWDSTERNLNDWSCRIERKKDSSHHLPNRTITGVPWLSSITLDWRSLASVHWKDEMPFFLVSGNDLGNSSYRQLL